MNRTLKWIIFSLAGIVILLVVLRMSGTIGKDEGIKVSAEKAENRTIVETVFASGKIYPEVEITLAPDISGEIVALDVQEGDSVVKGQVLAKIYGDIYATQRDQAAAIVNQQKAQVSNAEALLAAQEAQLEQAEKTYRMQKQLFDDKVISLNEYNTALATYQTAGANVTAARQSVKSSIAAVGNAQAGLVKADKDMSRSILTAPMSGIVSLLNVKEGERVVGSSMMAGTEMLRIADMSTMEVRVDVGENDVPKIHLGDSASVEVDAYNNRKFKGVVTRIGSSNIGAAATSTSISSNTSTDVANYQVRIRLDPVSYTDLIGPGRSRKFPFKPGMSASADIQTQTRTNVLSVPINAVTTRAKPDTAKRVSKDGDTQEFSDNNPDILVFIVDKDGTVTRRSVRTGIQDINYFEITDGLKPGEEVVTGPYEVISKSLKSGDKVQVVSKDRLFTGK